MGNTMRYYAAVLWLSRHEMSADQKASLEARLAHSYVAFDYTNVNETFPAQSSDAIPRIAALVEDHKAANPGKLAIVAGVFPAHIAAGLARASMFGSNSVMAEAEAWNTGEMPQTISFPIYVPVSVPAPAVEGETRGGGFVHHHWECI